VEAVHWIHEELMATFGEQRYHGTAKGERLKGHDTWKGEHHGEVDVHFEGAEIVYSDFRNWTKTSTKGHRLSDGA
jgi:hypothetical protein